MYKYIFFYYLLVVDHDRLLLLGAIEFCSDLSLRDSETFIY